MYSLPRTVPSILVTAFTMMCFQPYDSLAQECSPWTIVETGGPIPRRNAAMAFDERRGVAVYFGGYRDFAPQLGHLGDTWERGEVGWRQRIVQGPPPRFEHAMAYDSRRGVVILFGGAGERGSTGDTWEWDGSAWSQRSNDGPLPRTMHAMTFDERRGVVVMFGGNSAAGSRGDTWEWDGDTWTLVATTGPSPRQAHAMAYDQLRGVTVLHGGLLGSSETWEWNGMTWKSRGRHATTIGSPFLHSMVFDSRSGEVVSVNANSSNETWAWNGASWRMLVRLLPVPLHDNNSGIGYDSQRGVIVLVSGKFSREGTVTGELPSCPLDSDGDDVADPYDQCDESNLSELVVIDDCETGLANHLFDDGCTMMDRIGECEAGARNHGDFVTCVGDLARTWSEDGLIESNEKGDLIHCAAKADAPLRRVQKLGRG